MLDHESATPPRLRRFAPTFRGGERERRMMTAVPELSDWLHGPVTSGATAKAKAAARTHFGQFVKGEKIDDLDFMKRIEDRRRRPYDMSHQVWALCPRFIPQYRYFGVFVTRDVFLVCTKQSRDALGEHPNRWHRELEKTLRVWGSLFPSCLPHSGTELRDYVSHNAEHRDDRW
jgi:hypothetical protein